MAITLTTDPIVTEQLVVDIMKWSQDEARLAINSVSARFLKYTNRTRITSGAITLEVYNFPPAGVPVIWLRAAPVTVSESATFAAYTYQDGSADTTLTTSDYTLHTANGKLVLKGLGVTERDDSRDVRVSYTGGWTTVPGDVQESALQLMKLDKQRRDGMVGVTSTSREGTTVSYQGGDLPQSVMEVWRRYQVVV
ncbi:MAG TPA: hypothetical protein PLL30_17225 [Candidatus Krumholzibacteria bacterium]|nr:hypothetical protein [Candidatus Krumholzibacteria bacterium]HPD73518.1 hypothetical protein [Candidatus Krumholzibacteria bacterium]HRY42240.1 hypothetical protein [Candidatus Krumholzibacteria bacterium]